MLFSHLQMILQYLQDELPCPQCTQAFSSDDIEVLMSDPDELYLGIGCPKCELDMELEIQLKDGSNIPQVTINTGTPVSKEDLSNISSVLNKHKGGLKSFLKHFEEKLS